MSISKIQTGDKIRVISGKFKGHEGVISKVVRNKKNNNIRVAVAGVQSIAKFRRANKAYNMPGMQTTTDRLIHASNVSHIDENGKLTKINISIKDNRKVRVYKSTGSVVKKEDSIKEVKKAEEN